MSRTGRLVLLWLSMISAWGLELEAADIYEAIRKNNITQVKALLDEDQSLVRGADANGMQPIHIAVHYGQTEIVKLLISRGADVKATTHDRITPLHFAAHRCFCCMDQSKKKAIAETLISKGAELHAATTEKMRYGATPLHLAAGYGNDAVLKLLLDRMPVDTQATNKSTPLSWACSNGRLSTAEILIAKGADVSAPNELGRTPIMCAVRHGSAELTDFLIKAGASEKGISNDGFSMCHYAALSGNLELFKRYPPTDELIKWRSHDSFTLLQLSAKGGNDDAVAMIVGKGADVSVVNKKGMSAFLYAVRYCKERTVKLLLEKGASIKGKDKDEFTALHWASRRGHARIVELLLDRGAELEARTKGGQTPLHMAATGGDKETVSILLKHKANVNVAQATSFTPLHCAVYYGNEEAATALLEAGAFTGIKNMEGLTPLAMASVFQYQRIVQLLTDWNKAHPEAMETTLPVTTETAITRIVAIRNLQGERFVLIVVPFGKVDTTLVEELLPRLRKVLGITVLFENLPVALPSAEEASRMVGKRRQWNTRKLLGALWRYVGFHGRHNIGVIGITGEDLYSEGYNFLFGDAGRSIAVMSYHRFRSKDRELLLKRTFNQAISSTGLLFGILRCKQKICPRCYPNSLAEHDRKDEDLCKQCRAGFEKRFGVAGKPLYEKPVEDLEEVEIF